MKQIIKYFFIVSFLILARLIVRKYKPYVIMVTGSVGKTSTKDAIHAALAPYRYVRASEKSHNTEFGVPYTIFNVKNPAKNPLKWLLILKEALALVLLPNHYPAILVLEVGAERPGDLAKILRIATPSMVVVTQLPEIPVHVEAYESPEAVREEEFLPAHGLPAASPLIVSAEDEHALRLAVRVPARLITFGAAQKANVRVSQVGFLSESRHVVGMKAQVKAGEEAGELLVRGSVGAQQVLPGVAAIAVAEALGLTLRDALTGLEGYVPPPGRGRVFRGLNDSILIDETYNSSPSAVEESLATLAKFPYAKRRIAVLGDMLELGRYSVQEHERIGVIAKQSADVLISVGVRARAMGSEQHFDSSRAACDALVGMVKKGDVLLIKGSQGVRMECIVETLLKNPEDTVRLVRQEKEWKE